MRTFKKNDRYVLVFGDMEISSGDQYDDFPHTEFWGEFLGQYNEGPYKDIEIDLVLNGDIFDFLKMEVDGTYPHLIDEEIALKKLDIVSKAHPFFFKGIGEFVEAGNKPRRVHFIVGNHDMELLFPEVQREIISLCGGSGQILFPGFELKIGDLHIEHGNQIDSLFAIDPDKCFIEYKGKKILNLPWGTVTLLNAILPHRNDFYELDRIKPRHIVFDEIPHLREFTLGLLWNYWTKDYIRSKDPLKKITWSMVKEAFKRSLVFNSDVEMEDIIHKKMVASDDFKVYVVGHMHVPRLLTYGNRKLIHMGCFRDEFMYDHQRKKFELIPKSYTEIIMNSNRVQTSNMLEVHNPDLGLDRVPRSLDTYNEVLNIKLGTAEQRLKNKLDIEKHEEKEQTEE